MPSKLKVPGAQAVQLEEAAQLQRPAGQREQAEAAAPLYLPARQGRQPMEKVRFVVAFT